ncbi:hypothetical protein [Clostridium sporogenes]|uniref:hypothetical protein n=1 Tax=Clostridium sporogenes TaxID=1509 RepID=UPI0007177624|nr:hypothetical protein [Clostridium sporogenes]KRU40016.1 hypothetical protein VT94_24930 [Clostridium sporogenes]MBY7065167.1 hypothetical protein [Clostridium sporogenes]MBY7071863.1 hypothetical protein [Clostridium sporogenes]OQP88510.1 hypothetical protein VT93_0201540 [Clostridium sporogenes]UCA39372.1 hypothetical protein LA363_19885 [Clostridium sporogenes]
MYDIISRYPVESILFLSLLGAIILIEIFKYLNNKFMENLREESYIRAEKIKEIENRNLEKIENLLERELSIDKKFMYVFEYASLEENYLECKVQTKGKEYKVIFFTKEIQGEEEWYEPIGIKKIIQIR